MDGTMCMHHPRTKVMADFLADSQRFGQLKAITYSGIDRLLDSVSGLSKTSYSQYNIVSTFDSGWYCIRASLWAANYQLPKSVTALNNLVRNDAGVLLSCDACMCWEDGKIATFHCSFLANLTMDITAVGTNGTLLINDFIIPCNEAEVSFSAASKTWFVDKALGWTHKSSEHVVSTDLPHEALMVKEFSALVDGIKHRGLTLEEKWPTISRKTQLVIDAVMASIDKGCQPVEVVY
uniref:Gfo/Idh/MocA-like oxidoreductase C-terminal domain-containing protein n=1 Tax=Chenopodium quinoa TaxID=63459 RepID=A0A803M269_CHEQI